LSCFTEQSEALGFGDILLFYCLQLLICRLSYFDHLDFVTSRRILISAQWRHFNAVRSRDRCDHWYVFRTFGSVRRVKLAEPPPSRRKDRNDYIDRALINYELRELLLFQFICVAMRLARGEGGFDR